MSKREDHQEELCREIGRQEQRRIESRAKGRSSLFGLRMFGMVGWSVAVPTLIGLALGIHLDQRSAPGGFSWTLSLLVTGVIAGCLNAWYWVSRESGLGRGPHGGGPAQRNQDPDKERGQRGDD